MKPNLKTKRLTMRFTTASDFENIHQLHTILEVDQYNTLGIPKDLDETIALLKPLIEANKSGAKFTYSIFLKDTFIGLVGISPDRPKYKAAEVWFKYDPSFWGQGYATEVLHKMINYCFVDLNLHRVEAGCAVGNIGSQKVMEKAGMLKEGRKRQTLPLKTGWSDNFEYAILDSDVR